MRTFIDYLTSPLPCFHISSQQDISDMFNKLLDCVVTGDTCVECEIITSYSNVTQNARQNIYNIHCATYIMILHFLKIEHTQRMERF